MIKECVFLCNFSVVLRKANCFSVKALQLFMLRIHMYLNKLGALVLKFVVDIYRL